MESAETAKYVSLITGLVVLTSMGLLFLIVMVRLYKSRVRELKAQRLKDNLLIEEERKRFANDMHDVLGGKLVAARLAMEEALLKYPNDPDIQKALVYVDESLVRIKEISHNLLPGILIDKGFNAAIDELVEECKETKSFSIAYSSGVEDAGFMPHRSIIVFRIVQEILTNTLKHSKASKVMIRMITDKGYLTIGISDNGNGFAYNSTAKQNKFGLQNISSRIDLLRGRYELKTGLGIGTAYKIEIPLSSMKEV